MSKKKTLCFFILILSCAFCFNICKNKRISTKGYHVKPVPFTGVSISDSFWKSRIETNRTISIPSAFKKCEETGRVDNFAIAGKLKDGEHQGIYPFDDTDVFKVIEGASYSLAVKYDSQLDHYLDQLIELIGSAQEEDGYLFTCRTNKCQRIHRWMGDHRWEKLNSHELYNMGHLYEAAAAHYQATGKKNLLNVALKNTELIKKVFGTKDGQKRVPSGHPIIEMALVRLFQITGDKTLLDLARFFLDETGFGRDGHPLNPYSQDHKPIKEQNEAVGHAVRAGYLFSGVTDVAALTGDKEYIEAMNRLWENVTEKKLYITGGIGARDLGEGFGNNYELPNMTAYCETCASIANIFWNHRMFLLNRDGKYYDVLERTLYNAFLSGVSLSGDLFFYDNPLESIGKHQRKPWFGCACCPGNVTRFMPSIPGYIYAVDKKHVYINLFCTSETNIHMKADNKIKISQKTAYPWEGKVLINIIPNKPTRQAFKVRIPGWALNQPVPGNLYQFIKNNNKKPKININNKPIQLKVINGYHTINRKWHAGDQITLDFPMPIRRVVAHSDVVDCQSKVSIQRGPIIFCGEWPEYRDHKVLDIYIPDKTAMTYHFQKNLLGGIGTISGSAFALKWGPKKKKIITLPVNFTAIPYSVWNNRGPGEMRIWFPRNKKTASPRPLPSIASESTFSASSSFAMGLNDQNDPRDSSDTSKPFFNWWRKRGTEEWVQYQFKKKQIVSEVFVYWLEISHHDAQIRLPSSWRLLYKKGNEWFPVYNRTPYTLHKNQYNQLVFDSVNTNALRIQVQLQPGNSGGIIEWKVE